MSQPEDHPYSDAHLDSPEYRKRLLRKLNTLIAVLEVACAKVRRSLAGEDPDVERLTRIQNNLKETLQVCLRAKCALERCEQKKNETAAAPLPPPAEAIVPQLPARASPAQPVAGGGELGRDEQKKFDRLGPIDLREVRACDLDALCQRLIGGI